MQSLGASIVRVTVPNGPDKPYAVNQTRSTCAQEGETNEAVRDEIVQLVLQGRKLAESTGAGGGRARCRNRSPRLAGPNSARRPAAQRPGRRAAARRSGAPVAAPHGSPAPKPSREEEATPLPSIGVELVSMEERKGGRYFAIRDLRNGNVVQNVTIHSARKLWSYAINQHLTHPNGPDDVTWRGDLGLWQVARRAKKLRYDLALRMPDGTVRVFYGVTADGMTGSWAQFLLGEDRPEGEPDTSAPSVVISEEPDEDETVEIAEPGDILAPPENGNGQKPADEGAAKPNRGRGAVAAGAVVGANRPMAARPTASWRRLWRKRRPKRRRSRCSCPSLLLSSPGRPRNLLRRNLPGDLGSRRLSPRPHRPRCRSRPRWSTR